MAHLLFPPTAMDGLLTASADKVLRTRVHAAHGRKLREYRERIAPSS